MRGPFVARTAVAIGAGRAIGRAAFEAKRSPVYAETRALLDLRWRLQPRPLQRALVWGIREAYAEAAREQGAWP